MTIESNFYLVCQKGNLKMATSIYAIAKKHNKKLDINTAFKNSCENGNLEIAKWLYSLEDKLLPSEECYYNICLNGNLCMLKWILTLNVISDKIIYNCFDIACRNSQINITEYLYILYKNINLNDHFVTACAYGKIYMAKWILSLDKTIDLHYESDDAFRSACSLGNLDIAKWLMSFDDKPNIHLDNEEVFRDACINNYFEIAKWLYSLDDKPNIRANNDDAFKNACINQNIRIALWLTSICDDFSIILINNEIIDWKIKNGLENLYNKKEYNKIIETLNIKKKEYIKNTNNQCSICYGDKPNFRTSCNHTFCFDCFLTWYICHDKKECSYCRQEIIIDKCKVFL